MTLAQEDTAQELIREFKYHQSRRYNWDSHWREIAERIYPSHRSLFQSGGNLASQGEKRTQNLFDSTGALALNRFATIADALLTPRNQKYQILKASDPALNKIRRVALWFDEATRRLFQYRYTPSANFGAQHILSLKSLGAYGNECMYIDDNRAEKGLRYKNCHLAGVYFSRNHVGIVDTIYRLYKQSARQAWKEWGDRLPEVILQKLKDRPEEQFQFLHVVKPREDVDYERLDYKGMKYASFYVSMEGKTVLEEGGYDVFPYTAAGYELMPEEDYARSIAMDVLPSIKTLNEQKKTLLKQGHRAVDPIYLIHDDGVMDAFSAKPGTMVSGGVSAEGRELVKTLPVGNIAIGKDMMDEERGLIRESFFLNLFEILIEKPNMSATEVLERSKEKGMLLGSPLGGLETSKLSPQTIREMDLLMAQNLLPPMPPELLEAEGDYEIVYYSPLTRAQQAEEASGLMRTIESALNVVNVTQNPEPLDFFNWDEIIPDVSQIQGVPPKWMRAMEDVMAMRQKRAEAEEAQTAIQAAPSAAALMKASG